jgi:SAM-dependent methyltransferase
MSELSSAIITCRLCGGGALQTILDLGAQPPANSLRQDPAERLPCIPLILCRCDACGTLQLTETVAPDYLFRSYNWVTGTSTAARGFSVRFRDRLLSLCEQPPRFVVEVASNDGTFLKQFAAKGVKVLGVDPARNIAELAECDGIPTVADFFGLEVAARIVAEHGHADVVFARNVLAHVTDVRDLVQGMAHCLAETGVGAAEFHRADIILDQLHYDSIYHEHLFYHSLHSMARLVGDCGLQPFDVEYSPISGGSCVVYFAKQTRPQTAAFARLWEWEDRLGVNQAAPWHEFAVRCRHHSAALRYLVEDAKRRGKRIIGYGASARSSTLLNYCQIGRRHLDVIADRSPLKHNRYTPGTDILIAAPEHAFARSPDAVLLLAWNFGEEITSQIRSEQAWRGDIILPLPGNPQVTTIS